MPRHWLPLLAAALLVAILVAGCSSTPTKPTPVATERPIQFVIPPWGERQGRDIVWHFDVINGGNTRFDDLSLHLSVSFNNAAPGSVADTAAKQLPSLAPGVEMEFTLSTPYRGQGDYGGPVEIWNGQSTVDSDFLSFVDCGNC